MDSPRCEMSISLDDLEELEALSDFSDFSESGEDDTEVTPGASSDESGSKRSDSGDEDLEEGHSDEGTDEGSDADSIGALDSSSDSDDERAVTASEAAPLWKEVTDESSGRPYYVNLKTRETTWTQPPNFARPPDAAAETHAPAPGKEAARANHAAQQLEVVQSVAPDQAMKVLAKNTFARSEADMAVLLEWVLSVKFFQENARSSFVSLSFPIYVSNNKPSRP